ncbi:MAG TPA: hypothetical protein VGF71_01775 [Caulobacteraceae bacterium]|jgi:hypothetical protein
MLKVSWRHFAILVFVWFSTVGTAPRPPPRQQTPQSVSQGAGNVEPSKSSDERIADYTEALAVFTALLGIVSVFEVALLFKADRAMGRNLQLTSQQIALATIEFNATHRPMLVLRELYLLPPTATAPATVEFSISNKGEGHGTIIGADFRVAKEFGGAPLISAVQQIDPSPVGVTLDSGQMCPFSLTTDVEFNQFRNEANRVLWRSQGSDSYEKRPLRVVFVGRVVYVDRNQTVRRSSFHREYDFGKYRFGPGEDTEREYAD